MRPHPGVRFRHVDKATRCVEGTSLETATVRRVVHNRTPDENWGRNLYKEDETTQTAKLTSNHS